jgi:O-antigen/teichoic acid export membrane protein
VASVASRLTIAVWGILLARALGPSQYGVLSVALASIYAVQVLADAGAANYLTREITRRGLAASRPLVRLAWRTQLLLAAALGVLAAVASSHHEGPNVVAVATVVCVIALAMTQVSRGVLRGSGHLRLEAYLQLAASVALCLLTLTLQDRLSVVTSLWLYAVAQTVLIAGSWWVSHGVRHPAAGATTAQPGDPSSIAELIRVTLPFNLLGSGAALFLRADMVIVGWLTSPTEAGLYGAALQVFTGVTSIGATAAIVLLPHFVRTERDAPHALPGSVHRMAAVALVIGVVVSLVTVAVRGEIWHILGPGYRRVAPILLAFALGIPFAFVNNVLGQALLALHRERWVAWNFVVLLVVAVVLYPPLVSAWGGVGAAVGVSLATALSSVMQATMLARLRWGVVPRE